jgi:N-acetyl-anhydromuramyl-L-alanine amidase AmpD
VRAIDHIVVHCSATPVGLDIGAREIDRMHRDRGFVCIGYHFVVRIDGTLEAGRPLDQVGAHVQGHNAHSIGICLVGGLDHARHPANTFTTYQFDALADLLDTLLVRFPGAKVVGHRDLSPDKNHDGQITRNEWVKDCPCFDVREWLRDRGLAQTTN